MMKLQKRHYNLLKENKLSELKSLTLLTKWIFWIIEYGTHRREEPRILQELY